jgi:hypothetical protein
MYLIFSVPARTSKLLDLTLSENLETLKVGYLLFILARLIGTYSFVVFGIFLSLDLLQFPRGGGGGGTGDCG